MLTPEPLPPPASGGASQCLPPPPAHRGFWARLAPPTSRDTAAILTWQVMFSGSLALNLAPSPASPLKGSSAPGARRVSHRQAARPPPSPGAAAIAGEQASRRQSDSKQGRMKGAARTPAAAPLPAAPGRPSAETTRICRVAPRMSARMLVIPIPPGAREHTPARAPDAQTRRLRRLPTPRGSVPSHPCGGFLTRGEGKKELCRC